MSSRTGLFLLSLLFFFTAQAAHIQVIDFYSGDPITTAFVRSSSRNVLLHANAQGEISLSYLQPGEVFHLYSDVHRPIEMTRPTEDAIVYMQPLEPIAPDNFENTNFNTVLAKANRQQGKEVFPLNCASYVEYFAKTDVEGQTYHEHFEVLGTSEVDQDIVRDFKFKNIAYQSQPIENRLNFSVNYLRMLSDIPVFKTAEYPSIPTLFTQLRRTEINSRYHIRVSAAYQMEEGARVVLDMSPKNNLHRDAEAQVVFNLYNNRYELIRWKKRGISGSLFESKIAGGATDHYDIEVLVRFAQVGEKTVLSFVEYRFDLYDVNDQKKQTFYLRWTAFDFDKLYSPMFLLGNLNPDLKSKIQYDFSAVALIQYDSTFWNEYDVYKPVVEAGFESSALAVWSNRSKSAEQFHFQGLMRLTGDEMSFQHFLEISRSTSNHLSLVFMFYINPEDRPGKKNIEREIFLVEEGGIITQNNYRPTDLYLNELCEHAHFLFDQWFMENQSKMLKADTEEWIRFGIQSILNDLLEYEQQTQFGQNQEEMHRYREIRNGD